MQIYVVNLETLKIVDTLSRHSDGITSVSWSGDSSSFASGGADGAVWVWDAASRQPRGVLFVLPDERHVAISADGHYKGSPGIEEHLVYVVQTAKGQETLTPAEFARKYNWKNDPEKVRLAGR